MNLDKRFYEYQTKGGRINAASDIGQLLNSESVRLTKRLGKYLGEIRRQPDHLVLDAPCGYGNMLYTYALQEINCHGCDLDDAQVRIAKSFGFRAETMNIFDLLPDCQYNAISSLDFIEHIEKGQALQVLSKFNSMLKSGGLLILRTPSADSPFGLRDFADDPTHKWIGTSSTISKLLAMAGYYKIEIIEDWPYPAKFYLARISVATILRCLSRLYLFLIGFGNPRCLSPSMIIVARKL